MTARIRHVTVDAAAPHALAGFWSSVLGFVEDPADPNSPDDDEVLVIGVAGMGGRLEPGRHGPTRPAGCRSTCSPNGGQWLPADVAR